MNYELGRMEGVMNDEGEERYGLMIFPYFLLLTPYSHFNILSIALTTGLRYRMENEEFRMENGEIQSPWSPPPTHSSNSAESLE